MRSKTTIAYPMDGYPGLAAPVMSVLGRRLPGVSELLEHHELVGYGWFVSRSRPD